MAAPVPAQEPQPLQLTYFGPTKMMRLCKTDRENMLSTTHLHFGARRRIMTSVSIPTAYTLHSTVASQPEQNPYLQYQLDSSPAKFLKKALCDKRTLLCAKMSDSVTVKLHRNFVTDICTKLKIPVLVRSL
jgi:hypothetical protein